MNIKFNCKGLWYADEVVGLIEQRFGFRPEVSTAEGAVVVHPRPRSMTEGEEDWLRVYLEEHPQKSSEDRMVEEEQAEELRREALAARVRKVTDSSEISLKVKDVRDAMRALAELAGVEV